jgi:hypothetical protein
MELDHGVRISPLPHEMSPLDRAIAEYTAQAEQYHQDKAKTFSCNKEQLKHDQELTLRKAFLQNRRRSIKSQAQVQERLDTYRCSARNEDENDWIYTERNKRNSKIISYMEISGDIKPAKRPFTYQGL